MGDDAFYSWHPPSSWGPSCVGKIDGVRPLFYALYGPLDEPIVRFYRFFGKALIAAADAEHSRIYGGVLAIKRTLFTTWEQCCYFTAVRRLYKVDAIPLSFQQYLGRNYATPVDQREVLIDTDTTALHILGHSGSFCFPRKVASKFTYLREPYAFDHDVLIDLKHLQVLTTMSPVVRSLVLSRHDQAVIALWGLLTPEERYAAKYA